MINKIPNIKILILQSKKKKARIEFESLTKQFKEIRRISSRNGILEDEKK